MLIYYLLFCGSKVAAATIVIPNASVALAFRAPARGGPPSAWL